MNQRHRYTYDASVQNGEAGDALQADQAGRGQLPGIVPSIEIGEVGNDHDEGEREERRSSRPASGGGGRGGGRQATKV